MAAAYSETFVQIIENHWDGSPLIAHPETKI